MVVFDTHFHWVERDDSRWPKVNDEEYERYKEYLNRLDGGVAVIDRIEDITKVDKKFVPALHTDGLRPHFAEIFNKKIFNKLRQPFIKPQSFYILEDKYALRRYCELIEEYNIGVLKLHPGDIIRQHSRWVKLIQEFLKRSDFIFQFHTQPIWEEDIEKRIDLFEGIVGDGGKIQLVHGYGHIFDLIGARMDKKGFLSEENKKIAERYKKLMENGKLKLGSTNTEADQVLFYSYKNSDIKVFEGIFGSIEDIVMFESDAIPAYKSKLEHSRRLIKGIDSYKNVKEIRKIFYENGRKFYEC